MVDNNLLIPFSLRGYLNDLYYTQINTSMYCRSYYDIDGQIILGLYWLTQ